MSHTQLQRYALYSTVLILWLISQMNGINPSNTCNDCHSNILYCIHFSFIRICLTILRLITCKIQVQKFGDYIKAKSAMYFELRCTFPFPLQMFRVYSNGSILFWRLKTLINGDNFYLLWPQNNPGPPWFISQFIMYESVYNVPLLHDHDLSAQNCWKVSRMWISMSLVNMRFSRVLMYL